MNFSDDRESRTRKGNTSSKKRKRGEKKDHHGAGEKEYEDVPAAASSLLLKGSTFAVSTLVDASSEESPEAYSQIIALCKDVGAQTTGQVHKRVNAVIATESAVKGNTQRVRKAWKKGIPVISPDWIHACIKEGRRVEFGQYTHCQKKEDNTSEKETKKRAKVSNKCNDTSYTENVQEHHVDLGCCCVCHESSADGRTDCSWCVDCSVNRKYDEVKEKEVDLGCCCVCHENEKGRTDCDWCLECKVNKGFTE